MPDPPGLAPEPTAGAALGYARVSTAEQHLDLQVDALIAAGCYRVFTDTASGAAGTLAARPEPDHVLDQLHPFDTLAVWKLDRLGRSLGHLVDTVTTLADRGVGSAACRRRSTPPPLAVSWCSTPSPRRPSSSVT
jgi:DNA invertase Pin-like site-specific DNA recombinase